MGHAIGFLMVGFGFGLVAGVIYMTLVEKHRNGGNDANDG